MVMRRAAARCGEWAQHFSNASCSIFNISYSRDGTASRVSVYTRVGSGLGSNYCCVQLRRPGAVNRFPVKQQTDSFSAGLSSVTHCQRCSNLCTVLQNHSFRILTRSSCRTESSNFVVVLHDQFGKLRLQR